MTLATDGRVHDTGDVTEPGSTQPRATRTSAWLTVLITLLVVVALALGYLVIRNVKHRSDLTDARADANTTARQAIVNLDALSSTTIDADIKQVLDGATGGFKKSFSNASKDLKDYVLQRKTRSSGKVISSGVVRWTTDSAVVLVAVDRTVFDTTNPKGVVARDRWQVTLTRTGSRWLVSDLSPIA